MARSGSSPVARIVTAVLLLTTGTAAADAKCVRLGFSVNDYGKDGPTKDAMALLDKHIANWTQTRGISKYTAGKKDVKCELFLDFGVFDEHTCKASATVCWADGPGAPVKAKVDAPAPAKAARPIAPIEKGPAPKLTPSEAPPAPAPAKAKPKAA